MCESYTAVFRDFRAGSPTQPFKADGTFAVIVYRDADNARVWRARVSGSGAPLRVNAFNPQVAKLRAESCFLERLTPWNRVE